MRVRVAFIWIILWVRTHSESFIQHYVTILWTELLKARFNWLVNIYLSISEMFILNMMNSPFLQSLIFEWQEEQISTVAAPKLNWPVLLEAPSYTVLIACRGWRAVQLKQLQLIGYASQPHPTLLSFQHPRCSGARSDVLALWHIAVPMLRLNVSTCTLKKCRFMNRDVHKPFFLPDQMMDESFNRCTALFN